MTCRDAIDVIAEFLDHLLFRGAVEELEAHLRDCGACRAYLNTYQKTLMAVAAPEHSRGRGRASASRPLQIGRAHV